MRQKQGTKSKAVYDGEHAQRTLEARFMTPYHKHAQWAEFTKLKEVIGEAYNIRRQPLMFFDIGIGYARIPVWLSRVATWNKVARYVGIDISRHCVAQSRRIISAKKIANKVEVVKFDAVNLYTRYAEFLESGRYDLIVCTYFTAGDFKPDKIRIQAKEDGLIADYDIGLLEPNKDFVAVFKGAYNLLRDKGKIVIGSIYYDSDFVREIQENFYRDCHMTVITSSKDQFAATREEFWSERFDEKRIYEYLSWIPQDKIQIIPLDDYNFALMVVINK